MLKILKTSVNTGNYSLSCRELGNISYPSTVRIFKAMGGGHKHPLSCNPIPIRSVGNVVLPNTL